MRRESTEALFDTLFIADIGIDLIEYRQLGTVCGRDVKTGLPHQGEQTHCLQ